MSVSFPRVGKFSAIVSWTKLSGPFFLFIFILDYCNMTFIKFDGITKFPRSLLMLHNSLFCWAALFSRVLSSMSKFITLLLPAWCPLHQACFQFHLLYSSSLIDPFSKFYLCSKCFTAIFYYFLKPSLYPYDSCSKFSIIHVGKCLSVLLRSLALAYLVLSFGINSFILVFCLSLWLLCIGKASYVSCSWK